MSKHSVPAGDTTALLALFELRQKALRGPGNPSDHHHSGSGLDGFWLHRVLQSEGIESHVVDRPRLRRHVGAARQDDRIDARRCFARYWRISARTAGVCDGQGADAWGAARLSETSGCGRMDRNGGIEMTTDEGGSPRGRRRAPL